MKRSHILKQTCSWKLQVCLSMCDLFVTSNFWKPRMSVKTLKILVKLAFLSKGSSVNFASNTKRINQLKFPLKSSENQFNHHPRTFVHLFLLPLFSQILSFSPSQFMVKYGAYQDIVHSGRFFWQSTSYIILSFTIPTLLFHILLL